MTPATEEHQPLRTRADLLNPLYVYERQEIQTLLQQNLALVGAGLAYIVPVLGLIFLTDEVPFLLLLVAPIPVLSLYSFLVVNQALIEMQSQYVDAIEAELEAHYGTSWRVDTLGGGSKAPRARSVRAPAIRRRAVRFAYASPPFQLPAYLAQGGALAAPLIFLVGVVYRAVDDGLVVGVGEIVAGVLVLVMYGLWIGTLARGLLWISGEHGGGEIAVPTEWRVPFLDDDPPRVSGGA